MQILKNKALLQHYLEKHEISAQFDTEGLTFLLCSYKKGELLNARRDTASWIHFLVKGRIQIYHIQDNGQKTPLCLLEGFSLLGDLEFCGINDLPFLVEAATDILCVEIPAADLKESLLNDNRFLRAVLFSLSAKLSAFARSEAQYVSLEEKLLDYLKNDRPDHRLRGVEAVSVQLRCSRRQLQRVLRTLTDQKIIEKTAKGCYRLVSHRIEQPV